ncbi:uncharacterized protein LOC115633910 isoform X1 [Scaptodrosophila lebanonensis]|uniref:Uncharacterized protein LOC115633910 isoform X1 n=1 Tax=Drosophila lebanonensis TaxID=7225 RepID=A0A6J2UIF3_DROLE|nr:uncharacterized protein LOC115633910 isoform X1 [Scaptodrosophila lebanonensis]
MNFLIVLVLIATFSNIIGGTPTPTIANDELMDGKYLCEAGFKKFDGPFIVRMISITNGQTLGCFLCGQPDPKTQYHLKRCMDTLIPGKSTPSHRSDIMPVLIRMDPTNNKDIWSSKIKKNFDEIDKASASFSILNQLV